MSSSSAYYKSIYQRFDKNASKTIEDKQIIKQQSDDTPETLDYTEYDELYYKYFKNVLKGKREAKKLRKIHEEMFEVYVSKMNHITNETAKSYSHMIYCFLIFSSAVNPDDLPKFLKHKFNISLSGGTLKQNLKGTSLNYFSCINEFLKYIYSSDFSVLYPKYARSLTIFDKDKNLSPSVKETINAYAQLHELKKHEVALILNLIYFLGVNPETIVLMTYDSIDEERNMKYFDALKSGYIDAQISQNLYRDIMLVKELSQKNRKRCMFLPKHRPPPPGGGV